MDTQKYISSLNEYKNSLQAYREALQNKEPRMINEYHHALIQKYGILKAELAEIFSHQTSFEISLYNPLTEAHGHLIHEQNNLINQHTQLTIERNNTRSEADLIPLAQRKKETAEDRATDEILYQIIDVDAQIRSLLNVINPDAIPQPEVVAPVPEYQHNLNENELNTIVLDKHAFYRMIRNKLYSQEYSNEQYSKLEFELSEKINKQPVKVTDIIIFYQDNGITLPTDNDFRALIKSEDRDYKNTQQSVRDTSDNQYIKGTMTVSYEKVDKNKVINDGNSLSVVTDADSFYKLISNKAALHEYTQQQYYQLYANISEKLVHSTLTKNEINEFYVAQGITPLTEREWDTLMTRQETRRETDHIAEKSANLAFRGTIRIDTGENYKLNIDLYHNDPTTHGRSAVPAGFNVNDIPDILLKTAEAFNAAFGIRKLDDATDFRVFIFDSAQDYLQYYPQPRGHAAPSDNGNVSSIYLFWGQNNYQDPADLLRHEFVHALTFQATSKLPLAPAFMEGMAEYILHNIQGNNHDALVNMIPAENFNRSIRDIIQNALNENDHYTTGAAIVAFLEDTQPHFIDNLLYAAREARQSDRQINLQEMMDNLFQQQEDKPLRDILWFNKKMTENQKNKVQIDSDTATQHTHQGTEYQQYGGAQGKPGEVVEPVATPQQHADTVQYSAQYQSDNNPIDYVDVEKLYNTVAPSQKPSVKTLWDKLHSVQYNLNPIKDTLDASERYYVELLQCKDTEQPLDEEQIVTVNINVLS